MAEERPTAAFVLALIATIFHIIGGILMAIGGAFIAVFLPELGIALIAGVIVIIVLSLLGVIWLYVGDEKKATYGGVTTLVVAIVAFPTFWGLILGSILGLIGGILGIVWKPAMPMPAPVPQAPPPMPQPPVVEPPAPPEEPSEPAPEEPPEE